MDRRDKGLGAHWNERQFTRWKINTAGFLQAALLRADYNLGLWYGLATVAGAWVRAQGCEQGQGSCESRIGAQYVSRVEAQCVCRMRAQPGFLGGVPLGQVQCPPHPHSL